MAAVACAAGSPAYGLHVRAAVTTAWSGGWRVPALLLAGNRLGSDPFRSLQQLLAATANVSRQATAGEQITARVRCLGNRPHREHFPAVNQSAVQLAWEPFP